MKIQDGLLIVVTGNGFYEEEKCGRKPYTLRMTTASEYNQLMRGQQPDFIRIHRGSQNSSEYFTRPIVAIHDIDRLLGKHLVGITFDPRVEV